jgi:hypothetical protein
MMKRPSDLDQRLRHAREGCLTFAWLLDHPEEIDPERILAAKPEPVRLRSTAHTEKSCEP